MTAHWFLAMLLLINPLRGVVAPSLEPAGTGVSQAPSCALVGDCCPLCTPDTCPCAGDDPAQDRDPAPATPPTKGDAPRVTGSGTGPVWFDALEPLASLRDASPRAPPSHPAPVNAFLSLVCVWTT